MTIEQRKRWDQEKRAVRHLSDGLGMPVDRGIIETVAILRLLGIHTTASCAGHTSRVSAAPFVLFKSPRTVALERQAKELANPLHPGYKRLRRRAVAYNALETEILFPYLDAFYAGRQVPYTQRLIVQSFGPTANRLICQGAELLYASDKNIRRNMLKAYKAEMKFFTDYLKAAVLSDR